MKVVSRDERETEQEYNNRVEVCRLRVRRKSTLPGMKLSLPPISSIQNILEAFESSDEGKAVHRITHTFAVTSPMRQVKFNTGNNSRYVVTNVIFSSAFTLPYAILYHYSLNSYMFSIKTFMRDTFRIEV